MSRQEQILQAFANTKCLWPSIFHRLPPQPEPKVVKALQFVNPDLNFLLLGQKSIIKILYHLWKSASIAPFQTPGNILWSSCSCLSLQLHLLASNFNRYKPSDCRWFFFFFKVHFNIAMHHPTSLIFSCYLQPRESTKRPILMFKFLFQSSVIHFKITKNFSILNIGPWIYSFFKCTN